MQQRTDATGTVSERDAEVDPYWLDASEKDRDSTGRCCRCASSQVFVMERTVEIPQLQLVQQKDEIPESRRLDFRLESTPVRQI